ncbi:uncharacterized protein LOC120265590 isoform X1 [Dioscorea cayenensis subsp. rotundata]|uniref:Uncharacterized protein LOC120265590 isoform X1 n=1 Tax=Dioscorea cayennensis subsp. rotundata TaxID=55577 RepID=A0AB40BPR7_DIOCR|nr:uncharacterized protein LOC120265590 isoform X1 [Dioscorea cayenensis subsp. rotundata]
MSLSGGMDSPATGTLRPRRRPLQPLSSPANHLPTEKMSSIQISKQIDGDAGKENHPAFSGRLDASLAEELGVARRRRDRIRLERERTERMLGERDLVLENGMRDLVMRGEEQRRLELELLRLIGISDLGLLSGSSSPIRSLREREEERRNKDAGSALQAIEFEDEDNKLQELCSSGESGKIN